MYDILFTPHSIGKLEIKNRLVVSAAVTRLCAPDHHVTEAFIRYQEDKAKGGWGLIITEDQPVCADTATFPNLPGIFDDRFSEGHRELTRRVHEAGARICAQLYHAGAMSKRKLTGKAPVAPSAVMFPGYAEIPQALTQAQILEIEEAFCAAAERAKAWGYDMVEIHAAHGYLIHQFLSGNTNKRTDQYGGSLVNRNRFMTEILEKVRARVGADLPIQVRISAVDDGVPSGITLEESMVTARLAEACGADSIHCSVGAQQSDDRIPVSAADKALCVKNAEMIKKAVEIPVITVGRITEATLAENALRTGRADFVAMFRASLADPEAPNKLREGRLDEINYCIGCRQGCTGANSRLEDFSCLVRPMTGRAHLYSTEKITQPKNVLIVGGGVAGCEAAIYAAMRGHSVTVAEKTDELGGRWIAAAIPPGKADYTTFINYQKAMLDKYQVKVCLHTTVDGGNVLAYRPDVVLVAAGAGDLIPPIPGIDGGNVLLAQDVLRSRRSPVGETVVIGGGLVGAETAEYIASCYGKKVSIVEMLPEICADGEPGPTKVIKKSFSEHGVQVYTRASVTEIGESYVTFQRDGEIHRLPCETVVIATGVRPNDALYDAISAVCAQSGIPVVKIGDSASGKNGLQNIREGFLAGVTL